MNANNAQRARIRRAGFTLVELMIALLLTGVVSVVIYSLFDTTSDNFIEVDQLADTTDRLRFAVERVRNDVQMAGAQMTPDSDLDIGWVQPRPDGYRVAGIIPYQGWQGTSGNDPRPAAVQAVNPETSFDGFIVMGAYDFPLAFEVSGLVPDAAGNQKAAIQAHYRGLFRLHYADPFSEKLGVAEDFRNPATANVLVDTIFHNTPTRLLRVSDRQGYQQFVRITDEVDGSDLNTGGEYPVLTMPLPPPNTSLGPQYKRTASGADPAIDFGLDNAPEGDIGYDAAFIDAFWYHVVPSPNDPNIMRLVRERMCAPLVATAFSSGAAIDPAVLTGSPGDCPGAETREQVVVAENVADFQVWFDCADNTGSLTGAANQVWNTNWEAPLGDSGGACMTTNPPTIGRARVAHIRLTLHTETERKSQAHLRFEDRTGALCASGTCPSPLPAGAMLRTYDAYPTASGASRVVTMQADVALPNFANRNVL